MKGKFRNKIIGSCMVLVCLVTILFVKGILTEASDTTTEEIQLVTISNYTSSALETEISNQRANNYIYAGLYKSGTTVEKLVAKNVVTETNVVEGSTYVAKFVPEGVMGIKAQVSEVLLNNPDSTTSSIRFVTAIDSLLYKEVGFSITRESDTEGENPIQLVKEGTISKYVYEKLYGVDVTAENPGEPMEYIPQDIHALANYFKTYTITSVPERAYNTDLTIRPYWITHDGQTVYGTTGIKTVNFGRSWVYVNTTANADETEYGTYDHPFTDLAVALDAIVLDNNGKIIIQSSCENSTFTVPSEFKWEEHGKDLIITGEGEKTETLDFTSIKTLIQGDGVTFTNMTLKLYNQTGALYANGNRLKIDETVISNNPTTTIYGGGSGSSSSVSGTDVTILAGTYMAIYGGGRLGTVDGDTHVTIQNANVYSTTGENTYRYVCGGGKNGNVTGSTYVTIGEDFNKELEWETDATLSLVCGGGNADSEEEAIVEKNTYVVIEDGAKTSHVYGAGVGYSCVNGKSSVTCDGGYSMSIYGGGAKNAENASTSVVMKDGKVVQIFGGNREGMTGNTDVHILGGTILRRVYGGCYNEYGDGWETTSEVNGYVSVTFGPDTYASLATRYSKLDVAYMASSRYDNTTNEIGVFVLNDYDASENPNVSMVGYSTYFDDITAYHYFVRASTGGAVCSEGDSIRVIPDEGKVATVRVNNAEENVGTVHAYITSEGVCKLPTYDNTADVQNVYVVFTDSAPSDVTVGNYEATANGTHYATLEEALSVANTLSTTTEKEVVVNLLKENITVDSMLDVESSAKIKIQNADGVTAIVNRADDLMSRNLLNVADGATVTLKNVILDGRKTSELALTDIDILTEGSAPLINVLGDFIIDGATIQYAKNTCEGAAIYIDGGSVIMKGGSISNNYALSNKSGGAVSLNNAATFTMEEGIISNNIASASGGAFMVRNGSNLTVNDGTISGNKALVTSNNGGGAIYQHRKTIVNINGGTISGNQSSNNGGAIFVLSNESDHSTLKMTSGTIEENTAINGGGIYLSGQCEFNMSAGDIKNNTAKGTQTATETVAGKGSGVYVDTKSEAYAFVMTGGTISEHGSETSEYNSVGSGVYVEAKSHFKLQGNGEIKNNYTTANGAGVAVAGKLSMSGGTIQNNTTTSDGGGVYVLEGGTFTMNTTTSITNNTAADGGGVYHNGGTFNMKKGTISSNSATNGGGVYVNGQKFEMTTSDDKVIMSNTATAGGAGVYVASGGTFEMTGENAFIRSNNASKNGAGVYVASTQQEDGSYTTGTFNMNNGKIQDNNSGANGGGVYLHTGVPMTMTGGLIGGTGDSEKNHCTANGGAICAAGGNNITLQAGEISGNTATGNVQGVFVTQSKDISQVTLYTSFIIRNEIRYNHIATSNRGTDNPILKIIGDNLNDTLYLGFHPGEKCSAYVQCLKEENGELVANPELAQQIFGDSSIYDGTTDVEMIKQYRNASGKLLTSWKFYDDNVQEGFIKVVY